MKSKIMVDYDFDRKETFLQLRLEGYDVDGGELPDKHLHSFIEQANQVGGLCIQYHGAGNALPQIRVGLTPKQDEKIERLYSHICIKLEYARNARKKEVSPELKNEIDGIISQLQEIKEFIDIDLGYDYTGRPVGNK